MKLSERLQKMRLKADGIDFGTMPYIEKELKP